MQTPEMKNSTYCFEAPSESVDPLILIIDRLDRWAKLSESLKHTDERRDRTRLVDQIHDLAMRLKPVFDHERFRAYCEVEYGNPPDARSARRLRGMLVTSKGLSGARADGVTWTRPWISPSRLPRSSLRRPSAATPASPFNGMIQRSHWMVNAMS